MVVYTIGGNPMINLIDYVKANGEKAFWEEYSKIETSIYKDLLANHKEVNYILAIIAILLLSPKLVSSISNLPYLFEDLFLFFVSNSLCNFDFFLL